MRLELTRVGLLVELANHYTTRGALFWDFQIQTNHIISARRPDFILIYKKLRTCKIVDFDVQADIE